MTDFDIIIKGGTVSTASDTFKADIAINGQRIVAISEVVGTAKKILDARDMIVLPGARKRADKADVVCLNNIGWLLHWSHQTLRFESVDF